MLMADLLSKKSIIICTILILSIQTGYSFESSFPFPFEFGHSSDIYFEPKKVETKQTRTQIQAARDILRERGIKNSPEDFLKYIKKNEIGLVKLMLDAGIDPDTFVNGNYVIYWAAKYNRRQISYLLLEKGANPNKDMNSPLRCAVLHGDYELAKILIDHNANLNYLDTFTNDTVLMTALKKKQYEIARLLIERGARVDGESYRLIKKKNLESKIGIFLD